MGTSSKLAQTSSSSSSAGAIPGTVYAVGNGEVYGENGMSDIPELTYPLCVDELEYEPIIDIASSNFHSLALNRYGKLWSWGCKEYGALGRTGVESGPRPINHPSIRNIKFSKIACGNTISIAITANGQLYTWGTFTSKEGATSYLPNVQIQPFPLLVNELVGVNIVDIAAGAAHCLALSDKGHVYSWGSRDHLQLGRKITEDGNKGLFPTRIGTLDNIVSIACGAYHSFAVNRYGQLFAWGLNHFQQCGLVRKIPETEEILPGNVIHHPTMVPYFSRADQDYYQLRSSQKEDKGKQPNSQASDMQEEEIEELMEDETEAELSAVKMTPAAETEPNTTDNRYAKIKSVSCGEYHTIILMDNNRLVVFGRCDGGQLGVVLYPDYNYAGAMKLKGSNQVYAIGYPMENLWHCEYEIKKVVCGANHNLILTQDGATYGFGHSGYCQLGLYSEKDVKAFPTLIESIHNIGRVVNASAGDRFSMFIVA